LPTIWQLRAGVGAFLADDDPHALRPVGQVEQAGQLGDPCAVADLAIVVVSRRPRPGRDLADGVLHVIGHGEPDRVLQAAAPLGQPGQKLVRAAAGVRADQRLPPHRFRHLRQRQPGRRDVIGGSVRPGVPWAGLPAD